MSFIMSHRGEDAVRLLADGAVIEPDGTFLMAANKIYCAHTFPMAISGRGHHMLVAWLASEIIRCLEAAGSVDAYTKFNLRRDMHGFYAKLDRGPMRGFTAELVLCFWSEYSGPEQLCLSVNRVSVNGAGAVDQMTLIDPGPTVVGGVSADDWAVLQDRYAAQIADLGDRFIEVHALDILEFARARPGRDPMMPYEHKVFGIGGHVDFAIITPFKATTRRLRTWPDRVGEPIDPWRAADAA